MLLIIFYWFYLDTKNEIEKMHLEAARSIQHKRKAAEEQRQKAAEEHQPSRASSRCSSAASISPTDVMVYILGSNLMAV